MADCALPACRRTVADTAYVCRDCEHDLAERLHEAAKFWPELETTITRQDRLGQPGPRARGHVPPQPIRPGLGDPADDHQQGVPGGLPFHWAAAEVRDSVRNVASTWARVVQEERGGDPPADTPGLLRWLTTQLGWCRYQPWAYDCWDQLGDASRRVGPAVDAPANRLRVAVGPCPEVDCLGLVTATVPARLDVPAVLRCDGCCAEWGTHQWARVGRRMMARLDG